MCGLETAVWRRSGGASRQRPPTKPPVEAIVTVESRSLRIMVYVSLANEFLENLAAELILTSSH